MSYIWCSIYPTVSPPGNVPPSATGPYCYCASLRSRFLMPSQLGPFGRVGGTRTLHVPDDMVHWWVVILWSWYLGLYSVCSSNYNRTLNLCTDLSLGSRPSYYWSIAHSDVFEVGIDGEIEWMRATIVTGWVHAQTTSLNSSTTTMAALNSMGVLISSIYLRTRHVPRRYGALSVTSLKAPHLFSGSQSK